MKPNRKLVIIGLICGLFMMVSCSPTKQTAEFRQMRRAADTLIVIAPFLEINVCDFWNKKPDSLLLEKNREIITNTTNQMLSSRYVLKHVEMAEFNTDKSLALGYNTVNSSGADKAINQRRFYPELGENNHIKMAVFISFYGEYYTNTTTGWQNPMLGTTTIRGKPPVKPIGDLRLIVFNLQTDEIIFSKRVYTRNNSACSPVRMEGMVRKILRDIY